ncbi:MAG: DNA polymerase III subunit gamma/tau [Oscillospiraceae bacterium]|nr:DNA polymerase III subunit gamma/tau [Oscillospiraceae bacterium]
MYKALYTKWRPKSFDDVISQSHITVTLCNQIKNNRTAHAYLFTGSRGTGKTTCARIFAKAINCTDAQNGNPCNNCEVCNDADDFALSDIIEIDAASNNGVDDIRDLREGALFTPQRCRYKIYIIDEVHMLSVSAFNALLKLLEEPPAHVKFILATTEVHKIPQTILSRCQRFDFRRILPRDIADRLLYIAENEDFSLTPDAAMRIASLADGGMRDALSLLDQCAAFSDNIDSDTVANAAGVAGREYLFDIMKSVAQKDAAKALDIISGLYAKSKDMQRLCADLVTQYRNLMLLKASNGDSSLLDCMPDELDILNELSKDYSLSTIISVLGEISSCADSLVRAVNKRAHVEMCFIRLSTENAGTQSSSSSVDSSEIDEIKSRIDVLERRIAQMSNATLASAAQSATFTPEKQAAPKEENSETQVDLSKISPQDFKRVDRWNEVIDEFFRTSPSVAGSLDGSAAYAYENIMLIITKNPFFMQLFKAPENKAALSESIKAVLGKQYIIRAKVKAAQSATVDKSEAFVKNAQASGIPTEIIPEGRI